MKQDALARLDADGFARAMRAPIYRKKIVADAESGFETRVARRFYGDLIHIVQRSDAVSRRQKTSRHLHVVEVGREFLERQENLAIVGSRLIAGFDIHEPGLTVVGTKR